MQISQLETARLVLRQWKKSDFPDFALLNSDPEVMEYFPNTLSKSESDSMAERCKSLISERGWGFWVAELKENSRFLGFVGLHQPKDTLPFSPCVEIGWRLSKQYWGKGYATEAANRSLLYAFEDLQFDEVVSFTPDSNSRSRAVMERLGMVNSGQNFKHPDIPKNHPLSLHVLYKITNTEWQENGL